MGTRSTIKFYEGNDPLLSIYTQYDGYISGVGYDLANFLKDIRIVNGYGLNDVIFKAANGIGCLAAQYIAKFKTKIGGVYVTNSDDSQEYNYEVSYVEGNLVIKELTTGFIGSPEDLLNFKENELSEDSF